MELAKENKSSLFASFLFLAGSMSLVISEGIYSHLMFMLPFALLFAFSGLKLSAKKNQVISYICLAIAIIAIAYFLFTYKEAA
jgi:hypothetical protein